MKNRYFVLLAFVAFALLTYILAILGSWYYATSDKGGEESTLAALVWFLSVLWIGLLALCTIPIVGIIWARRKRQQEFAIGFVYAEIFASILAIGWIGLFL